MSQSCEVESRIDYRPPGNFLAGPPLPRRGFLRRLGTTVAGLSCADFLGHFRAHGAPPDSRIDEVAADVARASRDPRFLVYWYLEGGWCGYDMFNPVETDNNVIARLDRISDERYRVLQWGEDGYRVQKHGAIRHGFLADPGRELFPDMAVLSSMHTGSGHSRDRLKVHMGDYNLKQTAEREEDERSVMQAFAEATGQPYAMPSLSWHWWLSDGELNEVQYRGRRGYFHALGPAHAHTIYAGTPHKLKQLLLRAREGSADPVGRGIESFLDNAHREFFKDENADAVASYHSARQIYKQMNARGATLDPATIRGLFEDQSLKESFGIRPEDELLTYRSVNGNKARSKFSPAVNVQAMMSYEMMRAGLSCAFFIESRDVRRFDSHFSRKRLWKGKDDTPVGMPDQTAMMKQDLWTPLIEFVRRLKETEIGDSGRSYFDRTNIVITSEFGRTIHGNVEGILKKAIDEEKKASEIGGQDICAHWKVTSCAFLGGAVRGDAQYGKTGDKTLTAIPILPDGTLDPNFDPISGELRSGREPNPESFIPNHGDVYATALALSGVDPGGKGRNRRPPLRFVGAG